MIRREAVGEITALFGTTLLLLLMMSRPDWDEPAFQILWGAAGLGLVAVGSYLMLSRRRDEGRQRVRVSEEEPGGSGFSHRSE
jgi:preprotein translocase subunit Sss1